MRALPFAAREYLCEMYGDWHKKAGCKAFIPCLLKKDPSMKELDHYDIDAFQLIYGKEKLHKISESNEKVKDLLTRF